MSESTTAAELAMAGNGDPDNRWSIDRRVPLALIIAGIVQFGVACAAGAALYANVAAHGDRIARLETSYATNNETLRMMQIDVARIDERVAILVQHQLRGDPAPQ
jgi:hypothetical protein